ncbi:hypothetical protein SPB21_35445 [Leptothoe sp. ISB3NOV94-8A]
MWLRGARCSGGSRLWPLPPLAATRANNSPLLDFRGSPVWAPTPAALQRSHPPAVPHTAPGRWPPLYIATPPRVATSPARRAAVRVQRALRRRRHRHGVGVPTGRR